MTIDLSGKRCLVTGSSRGIGLAIASELLSSGATVMLHHNRHSENVIELQRQYPHTARKIKLDLNDAATSQALVQKTIDAIGGLDVLINNAGIAISCDISSDKWEDVWEKTFNINTKAPGILIKNALKHFIKQKNGYIVNISSRAAFRGDTKDYMAYAASKGALVALTRTVARAYGKDGIKAFDIAPGFTQTDMAQDFISKYGPDYVVNDLALNEITKPENISPTVAFLVSGLADHLTGTTIDINAGSYVH